MLLYIDYLYKVTEENVTYINGSSLLTTIPAALKCIYIFLFICSVVQGQGHASGPTGSLGTLSVPFLGRYYEYGLVGGSRAALTSLPCPAMSCLAAKA